MMCFIIILPTPAFEPTLGSNETVHDFRETSLRSRREQGWNSLSGGSFVAAGIEINATMIHKDKIVFALFAAGAEARGIVRLIATMRAAFAANALGDAILSASRE